MAEKEKYNKALQQAAKEFESFSQLPFAVCILSLEGLFLQYNSTARQLFNLPSVPSLQDNILRFYLHAEDREANLQRLRQLAPGQWLEETILDVRLNDQVCYLRDHSKAIWDEDECQIIGLLSLLVVDNKSARYDQLYSDLPLGVFCLREGNGLVHANIHFLEMHGYDSFEEVKNQPAEVFMNDVIELKEMEHKVREKGKALNQIQERRRKNNTVFTASVSARAIYGANGRPIGMEGIVEDISNEDIYLKMVDHVPMGMYKININELGEHILVHCNQQFARHLGADYPGELIGRDIRQFHKSEESFLQFHDRLLEKNELGEELVNHIVELVDLQGRNRRLEVHSNLLKDANGMIIGRVGAERDVTDYWETRQQLEELTTDIGKVLHSYSSTLIHSKHSMDAVMRSISSPDFLKQKKQIDTDLLMEQIRRETTSLHTFMNNLLSKDQVKAEVEESILNQLTRLVELIHPRASYSNMQQLALVRDGSIKVKEVFGTFSKYNLPKEQIKQIRRQLDEVLRLCSLLTLSVGIEGILEMETTVNNLRSYILTRIKPKEQMQEVDVFDLLIGAMRNMTEYASNRKIELRLNAREVKSVYIQGLERDLNRTLLNILHNAIKYSWVRKGPSKAYVQIDATADAEWLYIKVQNWGVAITEEEIEKGLVFKVGYRGHNSSDRRRPGTGLGLYDAQKVIDKHQGKLFISSNPSLGNSKDDYSKPFVTTVTIQLPRD